MEGQECQGPQRELMILRKWEVALVALVVLLPQMVLQVQLWVQAVPAVSCRPRLRPHPCQHPGER